MLLALAVALLAMLTPPDAHAATTTVQIGQQNGGSLAASQFNAATVVITAGDTVHWNLFDGIHSVNSYIETTPGTPDWSSGTPVGASFNHTFALPGIYTYYCSVHAVRSQADPANIDANIAAGAMVGKVVVTGVASVGGVADVISGHGPTSPAAQATRAGDGTGITWTMAGAAFAALLALTAATLVVRRARARA
jgi:plastocyanin